MLTEKAPKHLEFIQTGRSGSGLTLIYEVRNATSDVSLGYIRWYGAFRKYAFYPHAQTLYDAQCLKDIVDFLDKLMRERRVK